MLLGIHSAFCVDIAGLLRTAAGIRYSALSSKSAEDKGGPEMATVDEATCRFFALAYLETALVAVAQGVELPDGDDKLTAEAGGVMAWTRLQQSLDHAPASVRRAVADQLRDAAAEVRRASTAAA